MDSSSPSNRALKPGITGCTLTLNCIELDYPFEKTIQSMLPVVDEMLVSDAGSTDGTLAVLTEWAQWEPKLRILSHPESLWPNGPEVGNSWVNAVRKEAAYEMFMWLDADEVCDPGAYDELRLAAAAREQRIFRFINFWIDAQHECPWGDGRKMHFQRSDQFMHVHGENPPEAIALRANAKTHPSLVSYHYSSLRKKEPFYEKCRRVALRHNCDSKDETLREADRIGVPFMEAFRDRHAATVPFTGKHPEFMHAWLIERGWKP